MAINQHQQHRPVVVGTITVGAKIPTPKATAIPAVKQAYADGMAVGASYDDITTAMKQADKNCPPYPLMPTNQSYFSVNQGNFSAPGASEPSHHQA